MTDLPFSGRETLLSTLYFTPRGKLRAADDHYTPFREKSKTDLVLFCKGIHMFWRSAFPIDTFPPIHYNLGESNLKKPVIPGNKET